MDSEGTTRRRLLAVAGAAAFGAGCAAAPGSTGTDPSGTGTAGGSPDDGANSTDPGTPAADAGVYTRVYRETIDSVVLVQVLDADAAGQGSGWVYDDAHVVTNQHVVGDADEVEVQFHGGSWRTGTVVGTDVYSDLAVIRLPDLPSAAEPLPLLASDPPIGRRVVAIGNPFGLEGSMSAGIVSGVDRSLTGRTPFAIPDTIQTDAPVNPGNSGGPLVTLDGEVVGVVEAGGAENIAFAISAPLVRRVVPALVADGEYDHSYMGVTLQNVSPPVAEANGLERARGVIIDDVVEGGPADGVLRASDESTVVDGVSVPVGGDVVVEMGGEPIPGEQALSTFLALETSPGDAIDVTVLRDGERTTVELPLGERPVPNV